MAPIFSAAKRYFVASSPCSRAIHGMVPVLTHLPEYDEYVGKHLLMSLTYLDRTGALDRKVQLHGIITRINEAIIAVKRQDTGDEFTLPADLSALKAAAEGEYRLKPSGDIVVNPDYLVVYTIGGPSADDTEPD